MGGKAVGSGGSTSASDGAEVDVFVGTAHGRGVVGVLLTADRERSDVALKILLDCTAEETECARRFCADVLGVGGHLVARAVFPVVSQK